MPVVRELVTAVQAGLLAVADPAKAPGMQAYMKSAMPYRGVSAPAQERLYRRVFAAHVIGDPQGWQDTARALWREAAFREERYAAIALTGYPAYSAFQTLETVPLYEEFIVSGAWWDFVDPVAIHRIGPLLLLHPSEVTARMLAWSTDPDRWRRRTSIICQIAARDQIDVPLLYACIEPNLDDRDFFVRKAIGWALRQHAWRDPDEIERYVSEHEDRLSPLSRREALKNLDTIRRRP